MVEYAVGQMVWYNIRGHSGRKVYGFSKWIGPCTIIYKGINNFCDLKYATGKNKAIYFD